MPRNPFFCNALTQPTSKGRRDEVTSGWDKDLDSIAVSLFGSMTVDTREIHIRVSVSEQKIQIIILILKRGPCLKAGLVMSEV